VQSVAAELVALLTEVARGSRARIAAFIAVGVFAANVAVAFGLIRYVAGLAGWLTRPANLPDDEVGTAILTTAASTTTGVRHARRVPRVRPASTTGRRSSP